MPITRAPVRCANCTAKDPTPPAAPLTARRRRVFQRYSSHGGDGGRRDNLQAPGAEPVECRRLRDQPYRTALDILRLCGPFFRPTEDLIARCKRRHAGTNGIDTPGKISALPEGKLLRIYVLKDFANRDFAGVRARSDDAHDHFARLRLRLGDIDDRELIEPAVGEEL
jgi:hypothetical protein